MNYLVHKSEMPSHLNQRGARFQSDPIWIALDRCRTFLRQVASPATTTASTPLAEIINEERPDLHYDWAVKTLPQRYNARVLKQNFN